MNWIELKALNNLYHNRTVRLNVTLKNSKEIRFLVNSLNVIENHHKSLTALNKYDAIYKRDYLQQFTAYEKFLSDNNLLRPQT